MCEGVVHAAKAAKNGDFNEYEGQKWHHWQGYPVDTIVCTVDGECVEIKILE